MITNHKIEQVSVKNLKRHPRNPRQGDIGAIIESIEANGFYGTIVAQKSTGYVLAGNHRLQAAQQLGITEVPVAWVDVDDDRALRILLVDNRSNDLAAYNEPELIELLKALALSDDSLTGTGYDLDALDELLANQGDDTEITEDTVPAPPVEAITKLGDVIELGDHRLVCGDSTEAETYQRLLEKGELVDLLLTDPPYNVEYVGKTKDALTIKNDKHTDEGFQLFLDAAFKAAADTMRPGAPAYIFHADTYGVSFRQAFKNAGLDLKQVLVWVKNRFVLGRQDYQWQHEPIIYGWKPGAAHSWYGQFDKDTVLDDGFDPSKLKKDDLLALVEGALRDSTVIREDRPGQNAEHPTMKPVELVARLIKNSSGHNRIVLDPFGGSGSTLIACEQLARRARLIELDPTYCDVIVTRWETYTGRQAKRL